MSQYLTFMPSFYDHFYALFITFYMCYTHLSNLPLSTTKQKIRHRAAKLARFFTTYDPRRRFYPPSLFYVSQPILNVSFVPHGRYLHCHLHFSICILSLILDSPISSVLRFQSTSIVTLSSSYSRELRGVLLPF